VENIKNILLSGLSDINEAIDHHDDQDQVVYLSSKYFSEKNQIGYELTIEVIASMVDKFHEGNYHSDRGDWEGRGSYWDVSSISIQSVCVFTFDNDEIDLNITNQEAVASITF